MSSGRLLFKYYASSEFLQSRGFLARCHGVGVELPQTGAEMSLLSTLAFFRKRAHISTYPPMACTDVRIAQASSPRLDVQE